MKHLKTFRNVAVGATIAGSLGLAALGIGAGAANAAPAAQQVGWAQWDGWDHGPGWGHDRWDGGPGYWAPPPPPPPIYDGGYGYGQPPCLSGPLGFVQLCA
jgi:hypothetical protein